MSLWRFISNYISRSILSSDFVIGIISVEKEKVSVGSPGIIPLGNRDAGVLLEIVMLMIL